MHVTNNLSICVLVFTAAGPWLFWALVGTALGPILFFRGFRMLQYKRLIVDTPSSKVRSASIGLVELSGMPAGPQSIKAPLTGDPCYYFRVCAWQLRQDGNRRKWEKVVDESLCVPFFLEDATGKVLVNLQGADLDLHCNFKDEIDAARMATSGALPNLTRFLAVHGLLGDTVRLQQYCVLPGFPLFVLGTLAPNRDRLSWTPVPQIGASRSSLAHAQFKISGSLGGSFLQSLGTLSGSDPAFSTNVSSTFSFKMPTPRTAIEAISALSASAQDPGSTDAFANPVGNPIRTATTGPAADLAGRIRVVAPPRAAWSSVSVDEVQLAQFEAAHPHAHAAENHSQMSQPETSVAGASALGIPAARGPEFQHQAQAGTLLATAVQDPELRADAQIEGTEPGPENSIAVIGKGARGEPFIVSYRSQREVIGSLAWKSALCIWGGPALALLSLYLLASALGWM